MEGGIDRYAGDCEARWWRRMVRDDGSASSSALGAKTRTPKRGKDTLASMYVPMPKLGDINFL